MTGTTRNTFNPGEAEVLVVDYFVHLWPRYEAAVPQKRKLLLVRDTTEAEQALNDNRQIKVVIIQGLSRYSHEYSDDSAGNTSAFMRDQFCGGFTGHVIVVSRTLAYMTAHNMVELAPRQVQVFEKGTFLAEGGRILDDHMFRRSAIPCVRDQIWDEWDRLLSSNYSFERRLAEGPEEALTWLEGFDETMRKGDLRSIISHLEMIGVDTGVDDCDCIDAEHDSVFTWLHSHHHLFNRAVWEVLARDRRIMRVMRSIIDHDWHSSCDPKYIRRLRTFLLDEGPNPEWVGTPPKR